MIEAAVERGVPRNDDPNADSILGVGLTHLTVRNGRRMSTWTSFVEPIIDSPLLTVITGAQVKTLVFDAGGRAAGIRLSRPGLQYSSRTVPGDSGSPPPPTPWPATELRCSGDVIVCGGVIGSPQLLLLSGLGPADDLRALGLDVRADLPGVGANLHDHALGDGAVRVVPDDSRGQGQQPGGAPVRRQRPGHARPDLQPLMSHFPMPVEGYPQPAYGDGYAIWPASSARSAAAASGSARPTRPSTRRSTPGTYPAGRRPGPARQPQALPRHRPGPRAQGLARPRDRPGPDVRTDADLIEYGMRNLITYHHQVGTCKMGIDSMAVHHPRPARPRRPRPPRSRRLGHSPR